MNSYGLIDLRQFRGEIIINNIYNVRCDIDRLEYYKNKGNEEKVSDYTEYLIEHTKTMIENFQEKEYESKNILCKEILERMRDQSAAMLLREILFDEDNIIDWDKAFYLIQKYMPELKMFN